MNSRAKGARVERQFRDELRAEGYEARRGQQYSGANGDPDVVCEDLSYIHFEVKGVEALNLSKAMDQAKRDAKEGQIPIVAHKKNHQPWMISMPAKEFWKFLRGDHLNEEDHA